MKTWTLCAAVPLRSNFRVSFVTKPVEQGQEVERVVVVCPLCEDEREALTRAFKVLCGFRPRTGYDEDRLKIDRV